MYYILALVVFFTSVAASSEGCSRNLSYLNLGSSAEKYVVGCLPDVGYNLPASWAGQIPIPGTSNDELLFWLFEAEDQSKMNNLIIWLNGGPGCSSLDGLTKENGPLRFPGNSTTPSANPYSWTKLANVLYIDQPVGSGYSWGSTEATFNTQVTQDFDAWLGAFYKAFPSLKSKNTYVMGESYGGIYIPYFTQALIKNNKSLPLNIRGIAIGDGSFGNGAALTDVVATTYLAKQNDRLKIPSNIFNVFQEADRRCGFTKALQQALYPPKGTIKIPSNPEGENFKLKQKRQDGCIPNPKTPALVNQSINACNLDPGQASACATFTTGLAYLSITRPCFNPYNIAYDCNCVPNTTAFVDYLNRPAVRNAIHAPNKKYEDCNSTVFDTLIQEHVTPPAYELMPDIIKAGIPIHIYSGDDDYFLNHLGTELAIQNMTWGGMQGFQKPPVKAFQVDGKNWGNWGYERGLSYHHILRAGHTVPYDQPAAAFAFVRDFVIGDEGYAGC